MTVRNWLNYLRCISSCNLYYVENHYPYFTEEETGAYRGGNYLKFLTRMGQHAQGEVINE